MGKFLCPECNIEVSDQAKNCPHCGYPVYLDILQSMQVKVCDYCGLENPSSKNICTSCGAALKDSSDQNSENTIADALLRNGTTFLVKVATIILAVFRWLTCVFLFAGVIISFPSISAVLLLISIFLTCPLSNKLPLRIPSAIRVASVIILILLSLVLS